MEGLLGSRYAILPDAEMIGNDTLCRASATGRDDSTSGETASDKSSAVFSKVMKFEQRKEYAKLLRDVSQRLGFLYDLTSGKCYTQSIHALYIYTTYIIIMAVL